MNMGIYNKKTRLAREIFLVYYLGSSHTFCLPLSFILNGSIKCCINVTHLGVVILNKCRPFDNDTWFPAVNH